jgi:hypothetical protein
VTVDFNAHLFKQLNFLWRSCESYDQGHIDEAVRIATVIRVLMHDTSASVSLLKRLNALDILLASTVVTDPQIKPVFMTSMGRLRITATETTRTANTDPAALQIQIPVAEWWKQVVYVYGSVHATRKRLVLAAANKDGGAHVDSTLTEEYEALMMTGQRGWFYYSPTSDDRFEPVKNEHLLYIRQMGFELLNSPELLALARSPREMI